MKLLSTVQWALPWKEGHFAPASAPTVACSFSPRTVQNKMQTHNVAQSSFLQGLEECECFANWGES